MKLYVRRVFIMDDAEQLLPAYLRFVRGVVDSNDLPLNVSREILQQSKDVQAIRAAAVKRVLDPARRTGGEGAREVRDVLDHVRAGAEGGDPRGSGQSRAAREAPALLVHARRATTTQTVSLADYVGRMKDGQDDHLLHHRRRLAAARNSPHLEIFRKLGVEVLLLHDRVDEWVASSLTEFEGKTLQSAAAKDLDLSALGGEAGEGGRAARRPASTPRCSSACSTR